MSQLFGKLVYCALAVVVLVLPLDCVQAGETTPSECTALAHHPTIGHSAGLVTTPAEPSCFATDLPTAGVWLVDVGIDTSNHDEARLDVVGAGCDPDDDASADGAPAWRLLGRSADSAVVEVRSAGRYTFCVSGRDPATAAVGVHVRTSFAGFAAAPWADATCTDPDPANCPPPPDYNPEHEPDPDPIVIATGFLDATCTDPDPANCPPPPDYNPEHEPDPDPIVVGGGLVDSDCTDPLGCPPPPDYNPEHEPDPDPFRWIDAPCADPPARIAERSDYNPEHEPDPDPILAPAGCRSAEALRRACHRLRGDDHGDLELCASVLGRHAATGTLDAGDIDVFRLDVTAWSTVRIEADGAVVGVVYNRQGHRLGMLDDAGSPSLVETLGPGAYFVHLSGEGHYSLRASGLDAYGIEIAPSL